MRAGRTAVALSGRGTGGGGRGGTSSAAGSFSTAAVVGRRLGAVRPPPGRAIGASAGIGWSGGGWGPSGARRPVTGPQRLARRPGAPVAWRDALGRPGSLTS